MGLGKFFKRSPVADVEQWQPGDLADRLAAYGSSIEAGQIVLAGSFIRPIEARGGDTIFANMYMAYDGLSDAMKGMIEGLKAIHTGERSYGASNSQVTLRQSQFSHSMDVQVKDDAVSEIAHPLVRPHPKTGRK